MRLTLSILWSSWLKCGYSETDDNFLNVIKPKTCFTDIIPCFAFIAKKKKKSKYITFEISQIEGGDQITVCVPGGVKIPLVIFLQTWYQGLLHVTLPR